MPTALEDSLSHAPLRKAVPPGHPPSSIWRLCSDIVADKVCQVIDHQWTETSTVIPQPWSDAHLVLIRKPAKSGKEAGHYRPIGLQDQLGKLTFKALLEPHRELIYALVAKYILSMGTLPAGLIVMPYDVCSITVPWYAPNAERSVAPYTISLLVQQGSSS